MWILAPFIIGAVSFHVYQYFPIITCGFWLIFICVRYNATLFRTAVIFLCGFLYAFLRTTPEPSTEIAPVGFCPGGFYIEGVFISIPEKSMYGFYHNFLIHNISVAQEGTSECSLTTINQTLPKYVTVFNKHAFSPGEKAKLLVKFKIIKGRLNPGGWGKGVKLIGYIKKSYNLKKPPGRWDYPIERLRYKIVQYLQGNLRTDIAGFLESITIGYRGNLSVSIQESFKRTGIYHILSISGTHFSVLNLFIFMIILRGFVYQLPYKFIESLSIYITPKQLAALISIPFLFLYLIASGLMYPSLRSFIFVSIMFLALVFGRLCNWKNMLILTIFIIVLIEPDCLLSLSFQLSFLCVTIIFIVSQKLLCKESPIRFLIHIYNMFFISLATNVVTMPLTAYYTHNISLIAPIANLIVIPLTCMVILPLSLIGSAVFLISGYFPFISVLEWLCKLTIGLVKILSSIPWFSTNLRAFPLIFVVMFYLSLILFFLPHIRTFAVFILCLTVCILITFYIYTKNDTMRVTFLDVGQADSAVVETPANKIIVIDTGRNGKEVEAFLKYRGINTIDLIIISHYAVDHSGGLKRLLETFKVKTIMDNGTPKNITVNSIKPKRGHVLSIGETRITILNPANITKNNNGSVVVKIGNFLFTGDIGKRIENELLSLAIKSQILKIAHHGSNSSTYKDFIKNVSPKYTVISAGLGNNYGHPHRDVLKRLNGTTKFITYRDGAISFTENQYKIYSGWGFKRQTVSPPAVNPINELNNIRMLFSIW
ncbi:MAG: DNA internalization-related competence protein ComEC/Rec2 [Candidatus Magnetoovum sp. WYHC-5]|nr:DNA internalization-related competence protein ComEC/Rec2 [Candidatus Magnetoovum sp. WYHC-5]